MQTGILQISSTEQTMIFVVLGIAILGLLYALFLMRQILAEPKGSAKMQQVWNYIRTGANAYLTSQLRTIAILIVVLVVVLFFSVYVIKPSTFAVQQFCPDLATAQETAATSAYMSAHPGADVNNADVAADIRSQGEAAIAKVGDQCGAARINVALGRSGAFLMGAIFSALVGFIGMNMAVQGNVRVAAAAVDKKRGYSDALRIAYRSGT